MQDSTQPTINKRRRCWWIILGFFLAFIVVIAVFVSMHREKMVMQQKISTLESQLPSSTTNDLQINNTQIVNPAKAQIMDAYVLARTAALTLEQDGNIVVAMQLLELAEGHLANLQGPKIVAIKNKLLADQEMLKKDMAPDYAAVQQKLLQLSDNVQLMPAAPIHTNIEQETPVNKSIATTKSGWLAAVQNFWSDLRFVVKIKKKNSSDKGIILINTELARSQLRLMIEQMRWALLHNNTLTYHNSIRVAQELLNKGFDTNSESVQNSMVILQELAQVPLRQQATNINDTVKSLQELLIG